LQQQLKQLGYYKNEITGIYGNADADAVAQFKKNIHACRRVAASI
jgi:peptidoglycan hydrolase-like protein with peptidoglycan-binding domain